MRRWKLTGKTTAFTNGVFDILHPGHLDSLKRAASFADKLIVGLNSDASVKRLKGPQRPVNDEGFRLEMLANLYMTDAVVLFEEDTPLELIEALTPDVLLKGADYTLETAVGAKEVLAYGGRVEFLPLVSGVSTTKTIEKIRKNP